MARPEDYKYSESHEWIKYNEKKKEATIGITDYAVKQLADLVHIDLPKVGDSVEQGAPFGEIESVKTVADPYYALVFFFIQVMLALFAATLSLIVGYGAIASTVSEMGMPRRRSSTSFR